MLSPTRLPLRALATLILTAAFAHAQPLNGRIQGLLFDARLQEAQVGVRIIDAGTGHPLASLDDERSFIPASNMKALTSAAALAVLGAEHVFETRLRLSGSTLYIEGVGDPAFADPELLREMDLSVEDFVGAWADAAIAAAEQAGVSLSEIVVDDRIFDDEAVHPSWPRDQLNRWYCAQVTGLVFHANVINVYVSPTRRGMSPVVRTEPEAVWLPVENRARTVSKGPNRIWVARRLGTNDMTLHGQVSRTAEEPIEVAVHDMPQIFARLLADAIHDRSGRRPRVRPPASEEFAPEDAETVAIVRTPIDVILRRSNVDSHNLYAECLIKTLGAAITGQAGSWSAGGAVLRMIVEQNLGPRFAADLVVADGSGMSRENRVTPRLMVAWLRAVASEPRIADAFLASLPVARESGTLRRRFREESPDFVVQAKTGYLNAVSTLSGYITDPETGRRLVFSILVNDIPASLPVRRVKQFQEEVVLLAEEWLEQDLAESAQARVKEE